MKRAIRLVTCWLAVSAAPAFADNRPLTIFQRDFVSQGQVQGIDDAGPTHSSASAMPAGSGSITGTLAQCTTDACRQNVQAAIDAHNQKCG